MDIKEFAPRYTGEESDRITARCFELYDAGFGLRKISQRVGLSINAIKSRMLHYMLRERRNGKSV